MSPGTSRHASGAASLPRWSAAPWRDVWRRAVLVMLCAWAGIGEARGGGPPAPVAPGLSDEHRQFLATVVRRTLADAADQRDPYEPGYVPQTLPAVDREVVLRLRDRGMLLAEAAGGPAPLPKACRDAALAAFDQLRGGDRSGAARQRDLLVEIEVIGEPSAIELPEEGAGVKAAAARFEAGIDGIIARRGRERCRVCPTEFVSTHVSVLDGLRAVLKSVGASEAQIATAGLHRFRTDHWVQPHSTAPITALVRGLTPVRADQITRESIDAAAEAIVAHVLRRQQSSGLFSFEYDAARDLHDSPPQFVSQAGVIAGLSLYAARHGGDAAAGAARKAIGELLKGLRRCPHQEQAAFIATPDGENPLGVTALLSIALAQHPDALHYSQTREELIQGLLWLQQPTGLFPTAFPPARSLEAQDYYPGEALLALATHYDLAPSQRINDAFDRSLAWYRDVFRERRQPAFVPWQAQAFAHMARQTRRQDYIDFTCELTDWAAQAVMLPGEGVRPDVCGGVLGPYEEGAGASSAAFLEAFAESALLARKLGDRQRVQQYTELTRQTARFVLQLQVRPDETYFCPSPADAIGGIRTSPANCRIRIDACAHALVGLIKAADVLFPEE